MITIAEFQRVGMRVLVLAAVEAAGGLRLISPGPEAELGSPVT